MRVSNIAKNTVICEDARRADTFVSRALGLMGKAGLKEGEGLVLKPCTSIHMCFMRFPIDVIFVKGDSIIGLVESIRPWRLSPVFWGATLAIELPAGTIKKSSSAKGDTIRISA